MAVGFEFATGWNIYKLKDGATFPGMGPQRTLQHLLTISTGFEKAAVIRGGFGWQMTVDGTEIEYVVQPAEESQAGYNQLIQIMGDLTRFVASMNKFKMQEFVTPADFPVGTFRAPKDRWVIHIPRPVWFLDIEAIPQVTGGVRLGRIRKLWRLLADPTSNAAKQFFSEKAGGSAIYSPFVGKVILPVSQLRDSRWPAHAPSASLRGLATLIATYLMRGHSPTEQGVGAVKYLFFVMSRTKFSALFNDLPRDEQQHYKAAKDDWVNFILSDVMSKVPGMGPVALNPDGHVIERKVTDRGALNPGIKLPITRKDWLKGMLDGRDLLSAAEHPLGADDNTVWEDSNTELGHRLRGLAGLGDRMDSVQYDGNKQAAIIEFRARQATLSYKLWSDYAARMHSFFTEINEGERHGLVDLELPELS